ncbi:TetR/AcrR family transcriptional regulator [Streptococcus pluranimalium]|uniref:TetR family transcriptional regulator n=1 Tax=Streptococcus pluranimalium TaxID=82348 RepID=A0A2L0D3V1_9STRE|nr:TetR/AcrR family transcriptional regulator [Streptococcus pluranimalium]AUW96279.1 TetR family transcriptional regulator [Streptococcus pluranimalium]
MTPTKRKIISAYASLLNEKSKGKITITDIVHRAQTSRTTFYHYFSGIDDLNNECINTAIDDINHILNKNLLFNIPILTEMLDYIKTNGCYFQSLKKHLPNFDESITEYIKTTIRNSDISDLEKQLEEGYDIPEKFAFELFVLTVKTIIYKWMETNYHESSQEIAETIHKAVQI